MAMKVALLERAGSLGTAGALGARLAADGFGVETFEASKHFYRRMLTEPFFAVVLDADLLDENDLEVFRYLRARSAIVVLGASGAAPGARPGLQADAWLDKPLDADAAAASLRRLDGLAGNGAGAAGAKAWRLDPVGGKLHGPCGKSLILNFHEHRVMEKLLAAPGKVIPKSELIEAIGGDAYHFDPHRLEMLIHRLRNKVKAATGRPMPLYGVRGRGYAMGEDSAPSGGEAVRLS
jgi:DNA-binding response OmpR family regulator